MTFICDLLGLVIGRLEILPIEVRTLFDRSLVLLAGDYRLGPLGPDRDQVHWHSRALFHELYVLQAASGSVVPFGDVRDVILPAGQLEVLGLALVEYRLVRRELVVDLALERVSDTDFDPVESGQDIELCQSDAR